MVKYGEKQIAKDILELEEILMDGTNRHVNAGVETFALIVRWFRSNDVQKDVNITVLRHNGKPYYHVFGKLYSVEKFREKVENQMEILAMLVDESAGYGFSN